LTTNLGDLVLFGEIMDGLGKQKKSDKWLEEGGRFIMDPARWLRGRRWTDKLEVDRGEEEEATKSPAVVMGSNGKPIPLSEYTKEK